MSLAIFSSSLKSSAFKTARIATTITSRPSSAIWSQRFYSTENKDDKDTKEAAPAAPAQEGAPAAGEATEAEQKKTAHEEALAAKDKQLAEVKVNTQSNRRTRTRKEEIRCDMLEWIKWLISLGFESWCAFFWEERNVKKTLAPLLVDRWLTRSISSISLFSWLSSLFSFCSTLPLIHYNNSTPSLFFFSYIQDRLLRTLADMENLRQRTAKEVANTKDYAIQKFAKDLLDTADILNMAIKNVPQDEISETSTNSHLKSLHTGVAMTRDELLKTFKRYGVESFDPMNEKFDPNLHQANFQVPMPGKEPGTVFDVQKIGFMIKGRVLRPAQVGVVQSTD